MASNTKNIIEEVVTILSKLPAFGPRSARRVVLHLLKNKDSIEAITEGLINLKNQTEECKTCHNIVSHGSCEICTNESRDATKLCILAEVDDMWNFEKVKTYNGLYHILGGSLSAISGTTPEKLNLQSLFERLRQGNFEEIIFANNLSPDGATTAFYIIEEIESLKRAGFVLKDIKITELANGIPIGASLEYMDEGTIKAAFNLRRSI